MTMKRTRTKGQTAVEYVLAVSVLAVSISFAFYQLIGSGNDQPIKKSWDNMRGTIEAPYP